MTHPNFANLPLLQAQMENRLHRQRLEPVAVHIGQGEMMYYHNSNPNVRDRRDEDDMFERVDQGSNDQGRGLFSCLESAERYKSQIVMVFIGIINIAIAYMLTSESRSV